MKDRSYRNRLFFIWSFIDVSVEVEYTTSRN